jgi:diamine N-acetyltransferase
MVTADNWEAVVELELCAGHEDLVTSNLYSVTEAQFYPDERPRAVYAGKHVVVGFLMYDVQKTVQEASIYCFKRAIPGVNRISILCMPENPVAKPFYASFGLVEAGRDRDGEVIAVLKL